MRQAKLRRQSATSGGNLRSNGAGIAVASNGDDLAVRDVNVLGERNDAEDGGRCSLNHFDVNPVTWRFGERRVAGDDRRIEGLCQRHVQGVVRTDVLTQRPRARQ